MRRSTQLLGALALVAGLSTLPPAFGAAGAPQPNYFIYSDGTMGSQETAQNWSVRITSPTGLVVPSTQGFGVDNNQLERTEKRRESLRFEFDDEGASSVGSGVPDLVLLARIGVSGLGAGESLTYQANYIDGSHSGSIVISASDLTNGTFTVTGSGRFLDYLDLVAGPTRTAVRIQPPSAP